MKLYTLLIGGVACALATSAFAQSRDTNGDGKIDKAETLAAARATFERMDAHRDGRLSLGETTSGSEIDRAMIAARGDTAGFTLDSLLASSAARFDENDTDKDGFMSRDELTASLRRVRDVAADGKLDKAESLANSRTMFERLDTDKDGVVGGMTLAEAQARAAAGFDANDTNKDGFLTPEEIKAATLASIAARAGQ